MMIQNIGLENKPQTKLANEENSCMRQHLCYPPWSFKISTNDILLDDIVHKGINFRANYNLPPLVWALFKLSIGGLIDEIPI